jgi:Rrf2 family cysteine metabolism transcriptional repressor
MKITTQGDYALRCILSIARAGDAAPVPISRIVEEERLPEDYIEQLLLKLRRRKIIKSVRGFHGGYLLERHPADLTILEVLVAVEGQAFEVICSHKRRRHTHKDCLDHEGCAFQGVWKGLKERIEGYLGSITIASLLPGKSRGPRAKSG